MSYTDFGILVMSIKVGLAVLPRPVCTQQIDLLPVPVIIVVAELIYSDVQFWRRLLVQLTKLLGCYTYTIAELLNWHNSGIRSSCFSL